jgi:hypothetical protein
MLDIEQALYSLHDTARKTGALSSGGITSPEVTNGVKQATTNHAATGKRWARIK